MVVDRSRSLSSEERALWKRLKNKRGKSKVRGGLKRVSVSIEQALLERVTAVAKKRHISRSRLFALALEESLAKAK